MIQFLEFIFRRKSKLDRYLAMLERCNNFYSKHQKDILGEWSGDVEKVTRNLSGRKPLQGDNSEMFLVVGRGSMMEN